MKQTAVEWFVEQLKLEGYDYTVEQALAMEKEQIMDAFKEGLKSPYHQEYTIVTQEGQEQTKSGQYYNETYGNKS